MRQSMLATLMVACTVSAGAFAQSAEPIPAGYAKIYSTVGQSTTSTASTSAPLTGALLSTGDVDPMIAGCGMDCPDNPPDDPPPPPDPTVTEELVIDASGGNVMFPMPSAPQRFRTVADMTSFFVNNLKARPVYDSNGVLVGYTGTLVQIGKSYYLDGQNNIREVTDPLAALVGGAGGTYIVGETSYSAGIQGTDFSVPTYIRQPNPSTLTVSSSVSKCNAAGNDCVSGHSWNTHWIAGFRHDVGTEVRQDVGGFQTHIEFCWVAYVIPWGCSVSTGSNRLYLRGWLFRDPSKFYSGGIQMGPTIERADGIDRILNNVPSITLSRWSWWLGAGYNVGDSKLMGPPDQAPTPASALIGACGTHGSYTMGEIGKTADGKVIAQDCGIPTTPTQPLN